MESATERMRPGCEKNVTHGSSGSGSNPLVQSVQVPVQVLRVSMWKPKVLHPQQNDLVWSWMSKIRFIHFKQKKYVESSDRAGDVWEHMRRRVEWVDLRVNWKGEEEIFCGAV